MICMAHIQENASTIVHGKEKLQNVVRQREVNIVNSTPLHSHQLLLMQLPVLSLVNFHTVKSG